MSDIDAGLEHLRIGDDPPIPPAREGLPPRYRMRADAHYVEQLDSALPAAPIRMLETRTIDVPRQDDDVAPSAQFVDSIRRHGVLQPLLVRTRGGRHQLIAGRKRLAAALALGLREVPCLVQRVDDQQAQMLAAASNVRGAEAAKPSADAGSQRQPGHSFDALIECLTAAASSANLLSSRSPLTQTVAADLVRAETARALQLLTALRVLTADVAISRRVITTRAVVERAAEQAAAERQLRAIDLTIVPDEMTTVLRGDEELLVGAIGGLLTATMAFIDGSLSKSITLRAAAQHDARVAVSVVHESLEIASRWEAALSAAEASRARWAGGSSASCLALVHAARRIAELHEGHLSVDRSDGITSVSFVVAGSRTA